jgi:outer membrane lipoprotein-sorting protein
MSELGDVLELLHGAGRSFRTVRLEAREWRHNLRLQAAYDRAMERARGAQVMIARLAGGGDEIPAETEVLVRAWFEQPNRVREERDDSGHRYVAVADGARWWQRMPGWATTSEAGDGWAEGQVGHSIRSIVDPWPVAATLELAQAGRTTVAGREAIVLDAVTRAQPYGGVAEPLAHGADRHELAVDAERGLLLRTASLLDGQPFSVVEVRAIAFDEPFDAAVFRFEPEADEEVVRPEDVRPGEVVAVEEAARRASFTVLVPSSLGPGWRSHVLYTPGREGTPVRETVHLALYRDDAMHAVSIRQTVGPWESWQTNGTEETERDGVRLRVSVGEWRRVLVERDATFVELDSQNVDTDRLVELALSLVPAPNEPPPLVG